MVVLQSGLYTINVGLSFTAEYNAAYTVRLEKAPAFDVHLGQASNELNVRRRRAVATDTTIPGTTRVNFRTTPQHIASTRPPTRTTTTTTNGTITTSRPPTSLEPTVNEVRICEI